ncbi:MAG: glycerol-3-phosphate 1-O-acyltransferase PlsY [Opitutaceae bacterium]|jgi:glycerol-3-phosphate acyltransferase PlsY|nr:glycerol-3-phosphate 1-O-acyltransferase PlsY [Opitutaceae bacterium]
MLLPLLIAAVIGYLLGALPFGWLIARKFGINIFEHGSKNPGATNVKRVLGEKFGAKGKRAGDLAFFLDALKGAAAVGVAKVVAAKWTSNGSGDVSVEALAITGLVFALIGHSFSCWTRFKGGKGVATSAGGLFVLLPMPTLLALVAWVTVFQVSRYVSLASIVASIALPAAAWLLDAPTAFAVLASILGVFVIARHKSNIGRLLNGTENKFAKKPAA